MKFITYLESNIVNHWRDRYLDYEYLKSLLKKEINEEPPPPPPSLNQSTTSLPYVTSFKSGNNSSSTRNTSGATSPLKKSEVKIHKNITIDQIINDHKNILLTNSSEYSSTGGTNTPICSSPPLLTSPKSLPATPHPYTSPINTFTPPLQSQISKKNKKRPDTNRSRSNSHPTQILTSDDDETDSEYKIGQSPVDDNEKGISVVRTPLLSMDGEESDHEEIEMDDFTINYHEDDHITGEKKPNEALKESSTILTESSPQLFAITIPIEKVFKSQNQTLSGDEESFFKMYIQEMNKVNDFFLERFRKFKLKSIDLCNMIMFLNEQQHLRNNRNINYLKQGFQDNFKFLRLLESFRIVNLAGFKKLIEKYEMIQYNTTSQDIKRMLAESNINRYEEPMENLIKQIKNIYARYFTANDLKLANSDLKGVENAKYSSSVINSHKWMGFSNGLILGVCAMLTAIIVYTYSLYYPHDSPPDDAPMAWLLFRISLLPILSGILFSFMTFLWERSGINYVFIFELKQDPNRSSLRYFRIGMVFIFFYLICLFFYVDLTAKNITFLPSITFPIIFMCVTVLIAILPFPIFGYPTRLWILKRIGKVVSAPFVQVRFSDFFMSIQLISLGEFLFNIQSMICVFNSSTLQPDEQHFCSQTSFLAFPLLNALPFYWRAMQCFRRYYETRRFFPHLTSAIRSIFSITTLILQYIALHSPTYWSHIRVTWFIINILGSFYKWYADLAVDWGFLLNRKTNPAWPLREKLVYKKKWIYYTAIVTNLFLRFFWLLIFVIRVWTSHRLDNPFFLFIFSLLEVLWAAQFIYFRVESEHCLSADHYSSFVDIPIPFSAEYQSFLDSKTSKQKNKNSTTTPGGDHEQLRKSLSQITTATVPANEQPVLLQKNDSNSSGSSSTSNKTE